MHLKASSVTSTASLIKPIDIYLFYPNLIGYTRILFAAISFYYMKDNPLLSMLFYTISSLLDAFDGLVARLMNQGTKFGAVLDMVTDRSATTCLLVHLSQLYPHYTLAVQFLITLDLSSHYTHMVAQLTTGSTTHKSTSGSSNKMLKLYYTSKLVLFMVCAGNELFFMMVYLGFHNQFWGVRVCALVMMPIFVLKQVLNLVQLVGAANVLVELDVEALKAKHKE